MPLVKNLTRETILQNTNRGISTSLLGYVLESIKKPKPNKFGVVQFHLNFLLNQTAQLNILRLVIKNRLSSIVIARQFIIMVRNQ